MTGSCGQQGSTENTKLPLFTWEACWNYFPVLSCQDIAWARITWDFSIWNLSFLENSTETAKHTVEMAWLIIQGSRGCFMQQGEHCYAVQAELLIESLEELFNTYPGPSLPLSQIATHLVAKTIQMYCLQFYHAGSQQMSKLKILAQLWRLK